MWNIWRVSYNLHIKKPIAVDSSAETERWKQKRKKGHFSLIYTSQHCAASCFEWTMQSDWLCKLTHSSQKSEWSAVLVSSYWQRHLPWPALSHWSKVVKPQSWNCADTIIWFMTAAFHCADSRLNGCGKTETYLFLRHLRMFRMFFWTVHLMFFSPRMHIVYIETKVEITVLFLSIFCLFFFQDKVLGALESSNWAVGGPWTETNLAPKF